MHQLLNVIFFNLIIMKTKTILSIAFLCAQFSFAQLTEDFEKASIVQIGGQKLEGFIKTEELSKLSKTICYKTALSDQNCTVFDTETTQSFQTEKGKLFELIVAKINKNTKEIKIFGNLILSGKASLYKTVFEDEEMYIVKNEAVFYVLQDLKLVDGELQLRDYNYRGYLNIATEGFTNNNTPLGYSEKSFIKAIKDYNTSKGVVSKQTNYEEKSIAYTIAFVGGGFSGNDKEFFGQVFYRKFFPKISRSTSLNVGLSYYNYQFIEPYLKSAYPIAVIDNDVVTHKVFFAPVELRQSFFSSTIRPNIFAGITIGYGATERLHAGTLKTSPYTFGYGILYGFGIESDIAKKVMLKAEYRVEVFEHLYLFGIGYNFSK